MKTENRRGRCKAGVKKRRAARKLGILQQAVYQEKRSAINNTRAPMHCDAWVVSLALDACTGDIPSPDLPSTWAIGSFSIYLCGWDQLATILLLLIPDVSSSRPSSSSYPNYNCLRKWLGIVLTRKVKGQKKIHFITGALGDYFSLNKVLFFTFRCL
jgi:hypothetical protein